MSDPLEPAAPSPGDPTPAALEPPAPAAPAAPAAATVPAFSAFHPASRLVIGGAAAVVVAVVLGVALGAWSINPFGIVMIVLALVAAAAAWSVEAMQVGSAIRPWQPVAQLAAGAVATTIAALAIIEMVGDLDDLDDYGGPIGLVLGIVVLGGAVAMLWGALQRTSPDLRAAERGAQVAALGAGLVLLAWVLHLTIGFWAFGPAIWGITAVVIAAMLLLTATDEGIPRWVPWVAVVLGLFGAWTAFGQWGALMEIGAEEVELGLDDIVPFLIYVAGILLVIGGGVLAATGGRLALPVRGADAGAAPPAPPAANP